jgi:plastocyanin
MSKRKALAALIGVCTAAALGVVVFTAAPVGASSYTVTITHGACSGGGQSFCYSPESFSAPVGSTITFVNNDNVNHNVASCPSSTICSGAAAFHSSWSCGSMSAPLSVAPGKSAQCTVTTSGTYDYYCTLHDYSRMHGEITVTGTPPTPTPTARPTPTPTARPTPTPSHSSGPTPTPSSGGGGTAPPTAVGATPTPAGQTLPPDQTPTAIVSPGSTPTADTSGSPTASTAPIVGTSPSNGGGGSGFPIVIVIIVAVVVIGGGAGAAVLIRRRSTA